MERIVFADPTIVALIRTGWVAIRVDADRRPDINERYNLGGWPTTALLTPDGQLLFGGTFFEADELASALQRSLDAFAAGRVEPGLPARSSPALARPGAPDANPAIDADAEDWLVEHLLSEADSTYGGFGEGAKYPVPAALTLLLARYRESGDSSAGQVLSQSLDAICEYLYDAREGGSAATPRIGTGAVSGRKNSLRITRPSFPICLEGATLLDRPHYRARAIETLNWVRSAMADTEHGGFFWSVRASGNYRPADRSGPGEDAIGSLTVDRTLYADANAAMAASWLIAGDALDDSSLTEFALMSLERVVIALYRPGAGLAHYEAGHLMVRGLLVDQVRMASALVTAARLTGRVPYVMLAEELMQYARRTLWDDEVGGFFDRKAPVIEDGDIGLMAERIKPTGDQLRGGAYAVLAGRAQRSS